jgi:ABC-type nitrate/sulfonate/bicarbonate transport system substrate-binding protein
MITVTIRLLWQPQAQFAGYLLAAEHGLARSRGVEIRCEPIDFAAPGLDALSAGRVQLAVTSPSHVLEQPRSRNLAFLLAVQQVSPLVYPVRRSSGLSRFEHLAGKPVAVWPGGEDLELRWALHRAGASDAIRVPAADTVAAFVSGEVVSAQMTSYHELHELERHVSRGDLICLEAEHVGAALIKDGLVADRGWLSANGPLAQAVVDAILHGWTLAFEDPEVAVAACRRARPEMTVTEHMRQLADIRGLSLRAAALVHGLGYPDPEHFALAARALGETGHRAVERDSSAVDQRFWAAAPPEWRRSRWLA